MRIRFIDRQVIAQQGHIGRSQRVAVAGGVAVRYLRDARLYRLLRLRGEIEFAANGGVPPQPNHNPLKLNRFKGFFVSASPRRRQARVSTPTQAPARRGKVDASKNLGAGLILA